MVVLWFAIILIAIPQYKVRIKGDGCLFYAYVTSTHLIVSCTCPMRLHISSSENQLKKLPNELKNDFLRRLSSRIKHYTLRKHCEV